HALEIPDRLEERDLQPVIARHPADIGRASVEGEEIILEDLDTVEAGPGDRLQLLRKLAADRNRRDGRLHRTPPATLASSCGSRVRSMKWRSMRSASGFMSVNRRKASTAWKTAIPPPLRSEEHTSELQSRENLVCR